MAGGWKRVLLETCWHCLVQEGVPLSVGRVVSVKADEDVQSYQG